MPVGSATRAALRRSSTETFSGTRSGEHVDGAVEADVQIRLRPVDARLVRESRRSATILRTRSRPLRHSSISCGASSRTNSRSAAVSALCNAAAASGEALGQASLRRRFGNRHQVAEIFPQCLQIRAHETDRVVDLMRHAGGKAARWRPIVPTDGCGLPSVCLRSRQRQCRNSQQSARRGRSAVCR